MNKKSIKDVLKSNEMIIIYIIAALCVLIGVRNQNFVSVATVITLARAILVTMMFAIAEMVVIVSGGIDVSFPAVGCAALFIPIKLMVDNQIDNVWLAFGLAILIGVAFGALNATLIAVVKLPPLIATLGVSSLINGGMLAFFGSKEISTLPASVDAISQKFLLTYVSPAGATYSLTILFILPVVLCIAVALMLKYTMLGRGIYAIGGDQNAARIAGFNVTRIKYFVYMFAGAITGVAAMAYCILCRTANPKNLMGSEMMVIAAVVVGGTRITGGHGNVLGTVLGVVLIGLIQNNLFMAGVPTYWQNFVVGLVIVLGTSITSLKAKKIAQSVKI